MERRSGHLVLNFEWLSFDFAQEMALSWVEQARKGLGDVAGLPRRESDERQKTDDREQKMDAGAEKE